MKVDFEDSAAVAELIYFLEDKQHHYLTNYPNVMKQGIILFTAMLWLTAMHWLKQPYNPTEENLKNREAFQDMKFGVFIHWGIYSMDGRWGVDQ